MTKSILSSRTFWLALLVALAGAAVEVVQAIQDSGVTVPGWALALVGLVQAWLRSDTRTGVYLRRGTPGAEAPDAEAEEYRP